MAKRGRKSKKEIAEELKREDAEKALEETSELNDDIENNDVVNVADVPPAKQVTSVVDLTPMQRAAVRQKGGGFLYAVKFIVNVNNLPQNPGEIAGFSEQVAEDLVRKGFAVFVDVLRK